MVHWSCSCYWWSTSHPWWWTYSLFFFRSQQGIIHYYTNLTLTHNQSNLITLCIHLLIFKIIVFFKLNEFELTDIIRGFFQCGVVVTSIEVKRIIMCNFNLQIIISIIDIITWKRVDNIALAGLRLLFYMRKKYISGDWWFIWWWCYRSKRFQSIWSALPIIGGFYYYL